MFDLLIRHAFITDPLSGFSNRGDIALKDGLIAEVAPAISPQDARETLEAEGLMLQPGIIDARLSLARDDAGTDACFAAAQNGATTLVLAAAEPERVFEKLSRNGCGLTLALLKTLLPGENISGHNPGPDEIESFIVRALKEGAFGIKLLGAHFPLSPEATELCFTSAKRLGAWISVQPGTTSSASAPPLERIEETIRLARGTPFLLTHFDDILRKGSRIPALLEAHPEVITEACFQTSDFRPLFDDIAAERKSDGNPLVDLMSSQDTPAGGMSVLDFGISLIQRGLLTPIEFARRTSLIPARVLGLAAKGFIAPGADADMLLYDPKRGKAVHVFVAGRSLLSNGVVRGEGGIFLTTSDGADALEKHGLSAHVIPGGVPELSRFFLTNRFREAPSAKPLIFPQPSHTGSRI